MVSDGRPVVLFVEDEYLVRLSTAEGLRMDGYEVIEAAHGAEALRVLESPSQRVDLLLTDVQMPGAMNGLGLAAWVRENRPDVLVAIWSGSEWATREARQLTRPELVFLKPVDTSTLVRIFRSHLGPPEGGEREETA